MSNIIPPLLSDTPPPPPDVDDHDEDEFGDFTGTNNLSYDYEDSYSPPESPLQLPKESFELDEDPPPQLYDINSNSKENITNITQIENSKDFHDKRKDLEENSHISVDSVNNDHLAENKQITPSEVIDTLTDFQTDTVASFVEETELPTKDQVHEENNRVENKDIETNCDKETLFSQKEITNLNIEVGKPLSYEDINSTKNCGESSDLNRDDFDDCTSASILNCPSKLNIDLTEEKQLHKSSNISSIQDRKSETNVLSCQVESFSDDHNQLEPPHLVMGTNDIHHNQVSSIESKNNSNQLYEIDKSPAIKDVDPDVDDFGDFTSSQIPNENHIKIITSTGMSAHFVADDFGGFSAHVNQTNLGGFTTPDHQESPESHNCEQFSTLFPSLSKPIDTIISDVGVDDFGDFNVHTNQTNLGDFITPAHQESLESDSFEHFATFSPSVSKSNDTVIHDDEDDDFGDFVTTSAPLERSNSFVPDKSDKILLLNERLALEKSTDIVKEIFPKSKQEYSNFEYKGLEADDKIFNQIKNITDTHALAYQWPKSASQKMLLRALNIDSRNIIHGPGWNPSMPRFAATLSVTPLQPMKSDLLTPIPVKNISIPAENQLVNSNPMEMGLTIGGLTESAESVNTEESPVTSNSKVVTNSEAPKLDGIQFQSVIQPLEVSKEDLEQNPSGNKIDDFDDFVSYLPTSDQENPQGHNILLRETHISNKDSDIVNWLEPTIVTPELSRKERQIVDGDEELEEFQMVVSNDNLDSSKYSQDSGYLTVKPLKVLQTQSVSIVKNMETAEATLSPAFTVESKKCITGEKAQFTDALVRNEDDFGDFTFSVPKIKPSVAPQVSAPILQPLKPTVLPSLQTSNSISWPDPGITDDEISRLEAYSRAQNKEPEQTKKPITPNKINNRQNRLQSSGCTPIKPSKTALSSKQNSIEDDEWSDFVSVKQSTSSPIHKLKTEKERSSTPDLPLSVLNLGTVQPARQPIPVITPNGLMQTKLSSNSSVNIPTIMPQANRFYSQPQMAANPSYQPSIISNQYASQAHGGFSNRTSYQTPVATNNNVRRPTTSPDDDEWSDFVSHQPTGTNQRYSTQPNQLSNWISSSPNIISNPTANLDMYHSVHKQVKKVSGPATRSNGAVPNISLPDLDFLAPKSRTTQRK